METFEEFYARMTRKSIRPELEKMVHPADRERLQRYQTDPEYTAWFLYDAMHRGDDQLRLAVMDVIAALLLDRR